MGVIADPVEVATAVAASAAFPLLLPAMERVFTFRNRAGDEQQVVVLADGGVYDNLALTPLEPDRSTDYTAHVYPVRHVIACDAGRGPLAPAMPHLWPRRVARGFDVVHRRAQDAGRARLHHAAAAGQLDGFVLAYLGMRDERLPVPLVDLLPRHQVAATRPTLGPWPRPIWSCSLSEASSSSAPCFPRTVRSSYDHRSVLTAHTWPTRSCGSPAYRSH
jgi:hypothetical protein